MNPIKGICPNCQSEVEVLPHETHIQRFKDCVNIVFHEEGLGELSQDNKTRLAVCLYQEINDFIISENIGKQRMDTTRQIQQYKKDNIKAIKKEA